MTLMIFALISVAGMLFVRAANQNDIPLGLYWMLVVIYWVINQIKLNKKW